MVLFAPARKARPLVSGNFRLIALGDALLCIPKSFDGLPLGKISAAKRLEQSEILKLFGQFFELAQVLFHERRIALFPVSPPASFLAKANLLHQF